EGVQTGLPAGATPERRVGRINTHLFHELGFCGNHNDYYDPRNSFLNEVLDRRTRSEEHTSELQSLAHLVCRLLLEKKKHTTTQRQVIASVFDAESQDYHH